VSLNLEEGIVVILKTVERRRIDRAGFTLMEVLVVVAILLMLAGAASIFVVRYLEDAKKDTARMNAKTLQTAVKTYYVKSGNYPESLEAVLQYIEGGSQGTLLDPWGNRFRMEIQDVNGQQTVVISTNAPDGELITTLR
jgi:general secretion pathway protein G